ncbi:predicted protein [Aspergillus nidulans FGSC A4]|uniref:3-carboxymuconate cyclase n=1 Tax=Emericella nidulans (strain FGSC A4 / ATCC 38163 / CBS 112.46 / NRRL 194 / M139) TaxID=227321 RepID=Q5B9J0_EMENI|nr:hypothetical protein [Aspergillus nidulans FGSC A4]EAA63224.1 predicted protein [Aspergillus nidulans FGSC A4]CBF84006.1 TPA: conserved hypothetical protein [Aspergillus nidulans FGSC A4]|eukprot:XP_660394.1 predicted protein [Aspergillus nidulans FGSC A4]
MRLNPIFCFFFSVLALTVDSHPASYPSKAIYLLTNNAENAIVGVPIHKNGLLGDAQATLTGGTGERALLNDGQLAGPDSLFSQGAVAVTEEYIFAVNPGCNTLSMLRHDKTSLSKLTLVGEPAKIPGDFPNTVAVSVKGRLVCVGTTGTMAGVSCTTYDKHGLGSFDDLRPFELGQSTPPVGPANTVSQVLFSADESVLYATVKGDGTANNTGHLSVFPVLYGDSPETPPTLSREDTRSSPNGTGLLFGSAIIPSSDTILVTDPGFGAAVLSVNRSTHEAGLVAKTIIPGQTATCWAAYSAETNSIFVTDVAVNRLVELDAVDARILRITSLFNHDPGLVDLVVVDRLVYALSPGNGTTDAAITVFDIEKNQQVQHYSLKALGVGPAAMGMAYLEL